MKWDTPVYRTSLRQGILSTICQSSNLILYISSPMAPNHTQKHWIKRGVALLTQLDDRGQGHVDIETPHFNISVTIECKTNVINQ